eukprot:CAMPEP_0196659548 /NCGR_PEP_ID=MMETSP1086-20130531/35570_1 /TAXON_ID=77921 /ORGANISM="Cyanoptyche  gloeocystis , Strain SAG4.97" /LENGTH=218 /DNA_ID=CAMNT_0041993581 /DNA_START=215 /DNA_END=871 /DNA_ORIENTATION=-
MICCSLRLLRRFDATAAESSRAETAAVSCSNCAAVQVVMTKYGTLPHTLPHPQTIDGHGEDEEHLLTPPQFLCSITGQRMAEPVVAQDGHSYDRWAIEEWFKVSNVSPLTGKRVGSKGLFPNFNLMGQIKDFENWRAKLSEQERRMSEADPRRLSEQSDRSDASAASMYAGTTRDYLQTHPHLIPHMVRSSSLAPKPPLPPNAARSSSSPHLHAALPE